MGDVVNLNQWRKRKAGDARARRADENAAAHGRSKAERAQETAEREAEARRLDGGRLTPPDAGSETEPRDQD